MSGVIHSETFTEYKKYYIIIVDYLVFGRFRPYPSFRALSHTNRLIQGKSFIRPFDFPSYARRYLHPAQSSVSREHQTGPSKISLSNPTYRRTVSRHFTFLPARRGQGAPSGYRYSEFFFCLAHFRLELPRHRLRAPSLLRIHRDTSFIRRKKYFQDHRLHGIRPAKSSSA